MAGFYTRTLSPFTVHHLKLFRLDHLKDIQKKIDDLDIAVRYTSNRLEEFRRLKEAYEMYALGWISVETKAYAGKLMDEGVPLDMEAGERPANETAIASIAGLDKALNSINKRLIEFQQELETEDVKRRFEMTLHKRYDEKLAQRRMLHQ